MLTLILIHSTVADCTGTGEMTVTEMYSYNFEGFEDVNQVGVQKLEGDWIDGLECMVATLDTGASTMIYCDYATDNLDPLSMYVPGQAIANSPQVHTSYWPIAMTYIMIATTDVSTSESYLYQINLNQSSVQNAAKFSSRVTIPAESQYKHYTKNNLYYFDALLDGDRSLCWVYGDFFANLTCAGYESPTGEFVPEYLDTSSEWEKLAWLTVDTLDVGSVFSLKYSNFEYATQSSIGSYTMTDPVPDQAMFMSGQINFFAMLYKDTRQIYFMENLNTDESIENKVMTTFSSDVIDFSTEMLHSLEYNENLYLLLGGNSQAFIVVDMNDISVDSYVINDPRFYYNTIKLVGNSGSTIQFVGQDTEENGAVQVILEFEEFTTNLDFMQPSTSAPVFVEGSGDELTLESNTYTDMRGEHIPMTDFTPVTGDPLATYSEASIITYDVANQTVETESEVNITDNTIELPQT